MPKIQPLDTVSQDISRDLALIALSAEDLAARTKVTFARDHDDLGNFSYLLFRVGGNSFLLQAYDDSPSGGTVLRGVDTSMPGGLARHLMQAVSALGVNVSEISWRSPLAQWRPVARQRGAAPAQRQRQLQTA